jgi:hypothetical protein
MYFHLISCVCRKWLVLTLLRFVVLRSSTCMFTVDVEGFLFSLYRTQTHTTVGRTPRNEGSVRRRGLYLTTQTLCNRQTCMPPVEFELTIPASARPQTYALDRAATGIVPHFSYDFKILQVLITGSL